MRDIKVKFKLKSLPKISASEEPTDIDFKKENGNKKVTSGPARHKSLLLSMILIIAFLFGGMVGLLSGKDMKEAYKKALIAQGNIEKITNLTKGDNNALDFKKISEDISISKNNLKSASADMTKINYLRAIPLVSSGIDTVNHLIDSGIYTTSAFDELSQGGESSFALLNEGFTKNIESIDITDTQSLLSNLLKIKPAIDQASKDLTSAEKEISRIPFAMRVSKVKIISDVFYKNVPPIKNILSDSSNIIDSLPKVLGFNAEKKYLLFFLNNNEMTPSGGFPGSFGILDIKDGKASDLKIENIYNFQRPNNINLTSIFHFSPDLPTLAKNLNPELQKTKDFTYDVDGILLVDTEILKEILKATGPILVENKDYDYSYLLNESNVIDVIERHTKKSYWGIGEPVTERKEILNLLLEEIINKAPKLEKGNMIKFIVGLERLIKENHLMFYFKDSDLQKLAEKYNAAGEINNYNGDYCMVVDDNLAWSKSHQALEKTYKYKVDLQGKYAELSLDYYLNHPGNWKIWFITSYTRIYLPGGSKIIKSENFGDYTILDDPRAQEYQDSAEKQRTNKEIFTGWMKISPMENKNYKLFYQLPSDIFKRKEYKLLFQKQPGTLNNALEVEINVGNKLIRNVEPTHYTKEGSVIKWKTDLLQDREFKITFW